MQKRILLFASPEGRGLYEKFGFEVEEVILLELGKYNEDLVGDVHV